MSHRHSTSHPDGNATVLRGNAALVVGHPGHELRIHHWVETAHPLTFVLTDGSGRGLPSRVPSTENVLRKAGAKSGAIFGRWTDAQAYEVLLSGNLAALTDLTLELANTLVANNIEAVVADAMEGFNPTHDLCRYVTNAAVLTADRISERKIANFDFVVVGHPKAAPKEIEDRCVRLQLDEAALTRKQIAAENYPELKEEIEAAISKFGLEIFATELLRPVAADFPSGFNVPPFYETYGENRVNEGHYDRVIRYQEHFRPLMEALWRELDLAA